VFALMLATSAESIPTIYDVTPPRLPRGLLRHSWP